MEYIIFSSKVHLTPSSGQRDSKHSQKNPENVMILQIFVHRVLGESAFKNGHLKIYKIIRVCFQAKGRKTFEKEKICKYITSYTGIYIYVYIQII